jgi:hypothetical protein
MTTVLAAEKKMKMANMLRLKPASKAAAQR